MNFFSAQDSARKRSLLLLGLFTAAVISLILMTCALVSFSLYFFTGQARIMTSVDHRAAAWMQMLTSLGWDKAAWIAAGIVTAVALASLFKLMALGSGGKAVAEAVGARRVTRDSKDPDERKLLNIVEEMAIASGTPVPTVYVMDEEMGINAFAAGYTPADAVVTVTRGCMTLLNRDELQGVIAHEFSHILNGDMKLNIRLIAVLAGILFIGESGRFILRSFNTGSSNRNSRGSGAGGILFLGLGLLVIGYVGIFFGNLIKAAVSRQREFLADASAVQFTRNPEGIGNALKLIGGYSHGAEVSNAGAGELSHLFFGEAITSNLGSLFDTHPPLEQRIRAIEPGWDGKYLTPDAAALKAAREAAETAPAARAGVAPAAVASALTGAQQLDAAIGSTGAPEAHHVDLAQRLIASIPDTVRDAAHNPWSARAVIYALLIDGHEDAVRDIQVKGLKADEPELCDLSITLAATVNQLDPMCRLPLMEMAMPALKEMSATQFAVFRKQLMALSKADGQVSAFEWALARVMLHDLGPTFNKARPQALRYKNLLPLRAECQAVLSFLACRDHAPDSHEAEMAYAAGARVLGMSEPFLPEAAQDLKRFGEAIDQLALTYPLAKPGLLKACAYTITADGQVSAAETELLRAIAAILDCPMPPLELTQAA